MIRMAVASIVTTTDEQLRDRIQRLIYFPEHGLDDTIADRMLELVKDEKALAYGLGFQDGQRKVRNTA